MRPLPTLALKFARLAYRAGPRAAARTTAAKLSRWLLRLSGYELATLEARNQQALADTQSRIGQAIAQSEHALQAALQVREAQLHHAIEALRATQEALQQAQAHSAQAVQRTLNHHADSLRHLVHIGVAGQAAPAPSTAAQPRISVIVPVHNRAAQIGDCVASVLTQRSADFELIVVDDGSTDGLLAALEPFRPNARLQVLALPRGGESRARNAGLQAATGDVIVNLDSDNRMAPGYLDHLATAYAHAPQAQCALAAMLWDDQATHVHLRHDRFDWDGVRQGTVGIDTNAFSYRRSLWQALGGWDESLTRLSDLDLALRYTREHTPLRVSALAALYDHRLDTDRITATRALAPHRVRILARYRPPVARPLRVLIVCYDYPQLSESYVDTEVEWMRRQGVEVEVCAQVAPGAPGRATVRVHRDGPDQAVRAFQPDLLHCHWLYMAEWTAPAAHAHGLPMTVRAHGFDVSEATVSATQALDVARAVYLFPHHAARHGQGSAKIRPLPSAINSQRHYPRIGVTDRRMVLRTAACLETKDIETFFHIAAACPAHRFVLVLSRIALRPHLPPHFDALNQRLGSPVAIRWDLPYDTMAALYAEAGIYLHTCDLSQPFGMPVSVAESMACGSIAMLRESVDGRAYAGDSALYYGSVEEAVAQIHATTEWSDAQWRTRAIQCTEHAYVRHADEQVYPALLDDWLAMVPPRAHGAAPQPAPAATA